MTTDTVAVVVGRRDGTEVTRSCVVPSCRAVVWVPKELGAASFVVCPDHRPNAAPSVPKERPLRQGFWAKRRRSANGGPSPKAVRAAETELAGLQRNATERRGRAASYILSEAERAVLQERFRRWDDAESERVAAELRDDLRVFYPDASDAQLAAYVSDLRTRALPPPKGPAPKEAGR